MLEAVGEQVRPKAEGPAIRLEGSLFSPDFLEFLSDKECPGQRPEDFGLERGTSLLEEIAAVYQDAKVYWQRFREALERLPEHDSATSLTRDRWMIPFFSLLGYELFRNPRAYEVDGETFAISHRAGGNEDAPPIHIAGAHQELGRRDPGGPRLSPHALVQEFLNRSEHLWGLVTNGLILRVLRKSAAVRRQAYLEFDLQTIFEADRFEDFVILYRLLHRSRLPKGLDDAPECWLEKYHRQSVDLGNRARDRLRDGVLEALKILGNGLLSHPKNEALREKIRQGQLTPTQFYEELLRLVYRFLFLFTTEERGILGGNDLYRQSYSLSRLRRLADDPRAYSEHSDLWLSLRVLWHLLRDHSPKTEGKPLASLLDLPVLDGDLFAPMVLEDTHLQNRDLLLAVRHLSYFYDPESHVQRRVNYAFLDVEELGSVYESLLEFTPAIRTDKDPPEFDLLEGTERKTTGSYYTPHELVQELVTSALEPVLSERLAEAKRLGKSLESAILSIRVIDPATGSGHFLLAAARRLGKELARIRTGEEEPAPEALREAIRDVITHCLYGVDKNPLAVELCKVALWIEGHTRGKPLTFLDHRIKCGDSLVGVFDLSVLGKGIPEEAYEPVEGDDRDFAKKLKNELRRVRREQEAGNYPLFNPAELVRKLAGRLEDLARLPENTAEEVHKKSALYHELLRNPELEKLRLACDFWTAAFFARLRPEDSQHIPRPLDLQNILEKGKSGVRGDLLGAVEALAHRLRFFHWPLEFPEVFAQGGFDVVLCNPPWERIKLQEEEFFATRDRAIADAPNRAARKRLIQELPKNNPSLWKEYEEALHHADALSKFLRHSGRFPLTARGDINTYSVFTELFTQLLRPTGRAGVVVPTGIATDDTNKFFFAALVDSGRLVSLYDFENREGLFPAVDNRYKFCLLTVRGKGETKEPPRFAFFLHRTSDLADPERRFTIAPEDFHLLNPNTRTAPIFRSRRDAELTKHIYRRVPVLVDEGRGEAGNPWGVEFLAMFHMANDSHLFRTREELEREGFRLEGNVFVRGEERYLPLYEAKMVHQFDHRWATYRGQRMANGEWRVETANVSDGEKADPDYRVLPRYWVPEAEVEARLRAKGWDRGWLLGWRNITNVTNERTVIAAVIPRIAVGHSFPLLLANRSPHAACLLAVLSSFVLDFAARQKVGGTNLTYNYLEQFPVLSPDAFDRPCPWSPGETLADFICPRVLELTYTAWDLEPFARDLGYDGPPFRYDPERRARLRAELDALFFLLYLGTPEEWEREATPELKALFPTPRHAVEYILDQFPIVRRNDEERYGEYRTKRLILEAWHDLQRG